jgi:Asp/Glu/hydantoin racemase
MKILSMLPAAQGVYPPEAEERRRQLVLSYATADLQIDIGYLPEPSGFDPWGGQDQPERHRDAEKVARTHELGAVRAEQAEKEGYDAFCPFGLVDVGVVEARKRGVKIPVVGMAESSALLCGLMGRRFARCSYVLTDGSDQAERARIASWGLESLYAGPTGIGIPNDQYPQRRKEVLERFVDCTRQARDMGAEIMGMIGMSICPTEFSPKELMEASGFPIMDGIAAQLSIVTMWHRTGLPPALLKVPR